MVLWVGRLDPVKGLSHLLEALAHLRADVDARLVLAGDGPIRRELEQHAARLGISDAVYFLGSRGDVPSLLKSADAFVFPSRTEGLPNAVLEAMAAGRAIVTTDVPGCRDLIEDGRNGLVVRFGDVAALTVAMRRVLQERALAARLGAMAAADVDERWHIRRTYEAYGAIYREIMSR